MRRTCSLVDDAPWKLAAEICDRASSGASLQPTSHREHRQVRRGTPNMLEYSSSGRQPDSRHVAFAPEPDGQRAW